MIKHVSRFWIFCLVFTMVSGGMSAVALAQDTTNTLSEYEKKRQEREAKEEKYLADYEALKKQIQEKQEEKNQSILQIAKAIKASECEELQARLEKEINWFEGTMQIINARGICGPKTPIIAFEFMKLITKTNPRDEKAWAYLGQFYEQGLGTKVDLEKAKHAYQFAVRALGVQSFQIDWNEDEYHPNRSIAKHWGLSTKDYVWSFTNPVLGPIEISALLKEELQWLKGIEAKGGEAVFTEAEIMLRQGKEGSTGWFSAMVDWMLNRQNDSKTNLALGFYWLNKAGEKYHYVPAYYPLAKVYRNERVIENVTEMKNRLENAAMRSNVYLVEALNTGTKEALMPVIELLRKSEDIGNNRHHLYYLLLVAQKEGYEVTKSELEGLHNSLEPSAIAVAKRRANEDAINDSFSGIAFVKDFYFQIEN
jgi:hypothetical protein